MKIYKYRPLSDFLFKELNYRELYFANYKELNDPEDLKPALNFNFKSKKQISLLIPFLIKAVSTEVDDTSFYETVSFFKVEENKQKFLDATSVYLNRIEETIFLSDIKSMLVNDKFNKYIGFKYDGEYLEQECERLVKKFLSKSFATCFSEHNDNKLMWSHYASGHKGICLEFEVKNPGLFPYEEQINNKNRDIYSKTSSTWNSKDIVVWDKIQKVQYQNNTPSINYFDLAPIFQNEYDIDVLMLSKSWTHKFEYEIQNVLSIKTNPWDYEDEWRAVSVNFDKDIFPEDRIRHYPPEALSAVYFGTNTPKTIIDRIIRIVERKNGEVNFFESKISSGKITFLAM